MTTISERTLLVDLTVSCWSARRIDRKVTAEVNDQKKAASDAGRYNKMLIAKSALDPVVRIRDEAREQFNIRTLPWKDSGERILTTKAYQGFVDKMAALKAKYETAVGRFVAGYPTFVEDAKSRLGDMFDADDYPTQEAIRHTFGFEIETSPVPSGRDFRSTLTEEASAAIAADVERRTEERIAVAMKDVWKRIGDVTGRMQERMTAYRPGTGKGDRSEGTFTTTIVSNIADLISILPSLNLSDDPKLDAITKQLGDLCRYEPEFLRESETARKENAATAKAILDQVGEYLA